MTTPRPDPYQAYLTRADTLFAGGDVVQAGQIWQAILKRDPAHQAARAGLLRVKAHFEAQEVRPDVERLLREGCTLFDMGQYEDARRKWEQILAAEPGHKLAFAYANDARRELGMPSLPPPLPGPDASAPSTASQAWAADAVPEEDALPAADRLVRDGIQIYDMGMTEEAVAKGERALELHPGHRDAAEYLRMA